MSGSSTHGTAFVLVGPRRAAKEEPMWHAGSALAYHDPTGSESWIEQTQGVRVLLQSPDARPTSFGAKNEFHPPQLLSLIAGPLHPVLDPMLTLTGFKNQQYRLYACNIEGEPTDRSLSQLVVVPVDNDWPIPTGVQFKLPQMRLSEGRLLVAINVDHPGAPDNKPDIFGFKSVTFTDEPLTKFVRGFARKDAADAPCIRFRPVVLQGGGPAIPHVLAELTPEGIEFDCEIAAPQPFKTGDKPTWIKVRLRLTQLEKATKPNDNWVLQLVANPGNEIADCLETLQAWFRPVGANDRPVDIEIDTRRRVPAVHWPLEEVRYSTTLRGLMLSPAPRWKIALARDSARLHLLGDTMIGGSLRTACDPGVVSITATGTEGLVKFDMSVDRQTSPAAGPPTTHVSWESGKLKDVAIEPDASGKIDWAIDLQALRDDLNERYKAAGVLPDDSDVTYAYLPIQTGWLQLPVPMTGVESPEKVEPPSKPPPPVRPLPEPLAGGLEYALRTNDKPDGRRLTVMAADKVKVEIEAKGASSGIFAIDKIDVLLQGSAGHVSGLLWLATGSPTATEVLPPLHGGPSSTGSPALAFGHKNHAMRRWKITSPTWRSSAPAELTILAENPPDTIAPQANTAFVWAGPRTLPVITAMPLTRTVETSGDPLATRELFPRDFVFSTAPIKITALTDGRLSMATFANAEPTALPPNKSYTGKENPAVIVTLPGIELQPASGELMTWQSRLRFDLPILDELFASARIPEKARPEKAESDRPVAAATTSLDMASLQKFWTFVAGRLELSRTQGKDAFDWTASPSKVDVVALIEPATWKQVAYEWQVEAAGVIAGLPFGHYKLDSELYQGSEALAGLRQSFDLSNEVLSKSNNPPTPVWVTGFAAAFVKMDDMWRDTRGLATASLPKRVHGDIERKVAFVEGIAATKNVTRVTLCKTICIKGNKTSRRLALWFRDLPMVLDGNHLKLHEEAVNIERWASLRQSAFDRSELPYAGYEWRLCNDPTDSNAVPEYDFAIGPFRFKPLRLLDARIDVGTHSTVSARIVGSVRLDTSDAAPANGVAAPFGPDTSTDTGNLVAIELSSTDGELQLAHAKTTRQQVDSHVVRDDPKLGTAGETKLAFRLDRLLVATGHEGEIHSDPTQALLKLGVDKELDDRSRFKFKDPELEVILFGQRLTLSGKVVGYDADGLVIAFDGVGDVKVGESGVVLDKAVLRLSVTPLLKIAGRVIVNTDESLGVGSWIFDALSATAFSSGGLQWLNMSLPVGSARVVLDHARGHVRLTWRAEDDLVLEPIAGLPIAVLKSGAHLSLNLAIDSSSSNVDMVSRSGFGHFYAVADPDRPAALRRFRHEAVAKDKLWTSSIDLDLAHSRQSRIDWPIASVPAAVDQLINRPATGKSYSFDVTALDPEKALRHEVTVEVAGQKLDIALLGRGRTSSWTLIKPWAVRAFTVHKLMRGKQSLTWTSIDEVSLIGSKALIDAATDAVIQAQHGPKTRQYAFAPLREEGKDYPSDPNRKDPAVLRSGIVLRAFAQAGFPMQPVAQFLANLAPPLADGVVLVGGSVSICRLTEPEEPPAGVPLHVSWITTGAPDFWTQDDDGLGRFRQAAEAPVRWASPDIDWLAGERRAISYQSAEHRALRSTDSGEIARILSHGFDQCVPPLMPVEQAFLRPTIPPTLEVERDIRNRPMWLRSLVALGALWARKFPKSDSEGDIDLGDDVYQIVPSGRSDGAATRLKVKLHLTKDGAALVERRLIAIGRRNTADAPLSGGMANATRTTVPTGPDQIVANNVRLRAQAASLVSDLVAVVLLTGTAGEPTEATSIAVPDTDDASSLDIQDTLSASDRLLASQALGWPTSVGVGLVTARSLGMGDDRPFQDRPTPPPPPPSEPQKRPSEVGSSLAGRIGSLSAVAHAKPPGAGPSYYALGRKMAFKRPGNDALPIVAPPTRYLSPTNARVVTPTQADVDAMLEQRPDVPPTVAPIVPPFLERTTFGLRPGVLQAEFDSLIEAESKKTFDSTVAQFGRPAHAGPTLIRQIRAPRSPALPWLPSPVSRGALDFSESHGRRTFVARDDRSGDYLTAFRLFKDSVTVQRLYVKPKTDGPIEHLSVWLAVKGLPLGPESLRSGLTVEVRAPEPADAAEIARRLAIIGLLVDPAANDKPSAALSINRLVLPFNSLTWELVDSPSSVRLHFSLDANAPYADLQSAIEAATGDTEALLQIRCAKEDAKRKVPAPNPIEGMHRKAKTKLESESRRSIVLPLTTKPSSRATLPVELATLNFADPSYDRELSGPGASQSRRDKAGYLCKIGLDRFEYGTDTPVYFAIGRIDELTGKFGVQSPAKRNLNFLLQRQTKGPVAAPPVDLVVLDVGGVVYSVDCGQAYGLTLSQFALKGKQVPVEFKDGDQLIVRCGDGDLGTLDVRANVVRRPIIAPPPAVYSLVVIDQSPLLPFLNVKTRVALHAAAPLPQRIEFVDLAGDLALGHIRRRAQFEWRFAEVKDPASNFATLVKVDRAGGSQLPDDRRDIRAKDVLT